MNDRYIQELFAQFHHNHNKRAYFLKHCNTEVLEYITNRFTDSSCLNESFDRIINNIIERPVCVCGNKLKYIGKKNKIFQTYCSNKCKTNNTNMSERHKIGCLKKYGVDNISKVQEVKKKKENTFIKHYGVKNNINRQEVIQTIQERYNTDNVSKSDEIKNKKKHTCLLHHNVEYGLQLDYCREKRKTQESILKEYETKRINGTLGLQISSQEQKLFELIKSIYPNSCQQYYSDKYPYKCDIFIPELNVYIEYNGFWTHGNKPYNNTEEDNEIVEQWKVKNNDFYKNAINTWTIKDVKKRNTAKLSNLNYIEIWPNTNINEIINLLQSYKYNLQLKYDFNLFQTEFNYYLTHSGNLNKTYTNSKIIKYFQQDIFYKKENELYNDIVIRNKLIENRCKYLNKSVDELTTEDLLNGFKLSAIHYGYSHFNPLWFKWFIEQYNIKTCYDPCGGWGHRLLGGLNLDLYIYNDLSITTYNNINTIIKNFNIQNTITYNEDANVFRPTENYEAMFTCPPYYNIEHYECGDFESLEQYNTFIDNLFQCFYSSNAKIFGLVIREDLLNNKYKYTDIFDISPNKANHLNKTKKHKEYLYIFEKS